MDTRTTKIDGKCPKKSVVVCSAISSPSTCKINKEDKLTFQRFKIIYIIIALMYVLVYGLIYHHNVLIQD